ncbi:MAG: CotH kinase family protein [Clostridiales bacterium]|nr:CotH kinase family protein [Clostridiales bacterium]
MAIKKLTDLDSVTPDSSSDASVYGEYGGAVVKLPYSKTDTTLTESGSAADAKVTGDKISTIQATAENNATAIDELTAEVDEHTTDIENLSMDILNRVNGGYVEEGYLYLTADEEIVVGPLGPFSGTGSGSSSSNSATLTVTNATGWLAKTVASGGSCPISITWSSIEDDLETGAGTMTITVNSTVKATKSIDQGTVTVDLVDYLSTGSNTVKVKVSDVYGNSRTINFSITVVAISLASSFDVSSPFSGAITFPYTPTGSVTKTMHFVLDGVEIGTSSISTSGRQQSYTIPSQDDGTHTFVAYFTAEVDGEEVTSNELYYEIMVSSDSNTTTLIASSYQDSTVDQYTSVTIPFYVYVPGSLTASEVVLAANGTTVNTLADVDRTEQSWTYRADTAGTVALTISCNGTVKTITLTVSEGDIEVEAETEDLVLYLSSYGRSNSEADPSVWEDSDNGISATLTDFNFTSDGWQSDDDGITVLRVSGDARVEIPLQIFASDFRSTGKTIELEFATRDVRNYDSSILSCMSGGRGIELTAQLATFASEQSSLSMQYKEDEHVRLSFVVEKRSENRLVYCYCNGIISGVVQYPTDDDFAQLSPVDISIGSNDCTMDIYCIRVYDNDLTRYQILDNWIADTQDGETLYERYNHNNVYDAYGAIVISQLPSDLPYLVFVADALPTYKGNKLTVAGYYTNPEDSSKDFTFDGASADVQGTSSAGYARKNYKVKFSGGFTDSDGETASTYAMRDDSVPTKTFTFKADVASSEGANNVELVRLYNDICPYQTPPQTEDSSIRQGIDGFPIVIFHNDGTDTTFLGKYNFNNDKGTEEVYGFADGDESWETLNNTSDRTLWKSADYSGTDWQNDYEARYPEDNTDVDNLAALAEWLVSTDQEQATGDTLSSSVTLDGVTYTADTAAYRLAKFTNEFEDYFMKESAVFYYLFTEVFLMVDSRAKNAFPTMFQQDGKWCFLPYDMDTAIGINNEGTLTFSYNLEDIDTTDTGADVYNGQQSVLWVNLREAFYDDIMEMYQELRSTGVLSYDVVETAFEEHQAKWPEAIFNEDAYYKYIQPLIDDGTASYLSMCQGSKAEQRKWWLYNRFRYMDSKYNAGDALSDIITLRGYAKADITVVPYADIYAAVKYGSYLVQTRASRNESYTLACPLDNVNDTEIYIYSSSQLADVGDLSGLMVGYADFSNATKLQAVKIGDSSDSYSNSNLTELYLGNNTLLQSVDSRNCPNLASTVDLSGCTGIEEVYFEGTSVPSVTLPNGGVLRVLHLPDTVTNLTIRNQTRIEDFTMDDTSSITTLWLENVSTAVDSKSIVESIVENSRVRLIGISWEFDSAEDILTMYDLLDTMRGLDESGNNVDSPQVSGYVYVDSLTGAQLAEMLERYPDVAVVYSHITSYVYFYNYDGSSLLYTVAVSDGADVSSPGSPSRSSTAQYSYTFVGWSYSMDATSADSDALTAVTADRTLYAAYSRTVRTYTVYFYNGSTLLQTVTGVAYGGSATYTGDTPVSEDDEEAEFEGWSPSPTNITGNTTCYAQFSSSVEDAEIEDDWETILANIEAGTATYAVGNYKELDLGDEGTVTMQIVGKGKDTLADGTGTATYSWISKELLATSHRMNPSLVTEYDYKEQTATTSTNSNTSVSANSTKTTSFRTYIQAAEVAQITNVVTATADGTLTITYAGLSSTYGTLTVTVNGTAIVEDYASTTAVTYDVEMASGDVVTIVAEYTSAAVSSSYASIKMHSTGTFTLTTSCNNVMSRYTSGYTSGTGGIGGWGESEMRTYLQETIKPLIPSEVQAGIKTVTKSQTAYDTSGSSYTQTTEDDVWIPDYTEVYGTNGTNGTYKAIYNSNDSRIKYKSGATSATYWWLRRANNTSSFANILTSGAYNHNYANYSYGVALGFCT